MRTKILLKSILISKVKSKSEKKFGRGFTSAEFSHSFCVFVLRYLESF